MFEIGERVVFKHKPCDTYVITNVDNNQISVFPSDCYNFTKYIDVSQNLFMSERIYLRNKKLKKICSKLEIK
jgi:hypothetical protein